MNRVALYILLAANLSVAVPVLAGGWTPAILLRLYWWELVPIGLLGIAWISGAKARGAFTKSIGYQIVFFVAHNSTFCVLYRGVLSRTLLDDVSIPDGFWLWLLVMVPVLGVSHATSLFRDFRRWANASVSPLTAMLMPYVRAVPVHAVLLVLVATLPATITGALIVVAVKTATDAAVASWYFRHLARSRPERTVADRAWDR